MKNKIFKANPKLDCYFETTDGECFFTENSAKDHARNLEDKTVKPFHRANYIVVDSIDVNDEIFETIAPVVQTEALNEIIEIKAPVENTEDVNDVTEQIATIEKIETIVPAVVAPEVIKPVEVNAKAPAKGKAKITKK
jgi:hypothetical protein